MPRKQYESYRYDDPDFEYTYPNSSTLRNKHKIFLWQESMASTSFWTWRVTMKFTTVIWTAR
jgi:hypothetical protein